MPADSRGQPSNRWCITPPLPLDDLPQPVLWPTPRSATPMAIDLYSPRNYDGSFMGNIPIRTALELSRNVPAVKLGQAVGIDQIIEISRTLGIESPLNAVTSLPLGGGRPDPQWKWPEPTLLFANNGWHSDPTFIVQVTDSSGNVLLDNTPKPQLVLDPWASAALTDVLQGVIARGTGTRAQIGRPAAGKTGTYRLPTGCLVCGLCTPAIYRRVGGQRRLLSHGFLVLPAAPTLPLSGKTSCSRPWPTCPCRASVDLPIFPNPEVV